MIESFEKDGYYEVYCDGVIQRSFVLKNGEREGPVKTYYSNGKLESLVTIIGDAHLHGLKETYFPNGQKKSEGMYKMDEMVGEHRNWHENGQPDIIFNFDEKGRMHGRFLKYFANGKLSEERNYYKSKLHGKWTFYRESGEFWKQRIYRNGNLIKTLHKPADED